MKSYRVVTLDAFTTTPFAGNPCAVLPQAEGLTTEQMQAIARETNLPETAFVFPSDKASYRVRYFTPRHEVPFAGHPTIATSYLLALLEMVPLQEPVTTITLEFNVGVLPVDIRVENHAPVQAIMTQQLPVFGGQLPAEEIAAALGLQVSDLRSDCPAQVVSTGVPFLIVPALNVDVLGKMKVDRDLLYASLQKVGVNAAFVFCLGGFAADADTHARFIDPKSAMEDPFTGSASGSMGAYIIHHGLKPGPFLQIEQGHFVDRPGRGTLEIVQHDGKISAVRLAGAAVKVMEGQVNLES